MDWIMPEWLVALATTLFLVDMFLSTEVLSWGGVLSLAGWLTWRIHADWKWSVLLFMGSFVIFSFVYYFGIRATVGRFVRSWMLRGASKEVSERMAGAVGSIHQVEGRSYFKWNGDELFPISHRNGSRCFKEGEIVEVERVENGMVILK